MDDILINQHSRFQLESLILLIAYDKDSEHKSWNVTIDDTKYDIVIKVNDNMQIDPNFSLIMKNKQFSTIRSWLFNSTITGKYAAILYNYLLNLETSQRVSQLDNIYNQMNDKMQLIVDLLDLNKTKQ